ncbi:transcriptional regulator [Micromonospora sp. ATCC 39149]|uniref:GntR family transcriptional regulator n=1 Tax=Micromonospora sp. (strain ATCC 39149 / NRRL 15099 / SCC 1413) TaxID=219305 RepID=UPI0001A504BD|nr:UTRA domain-containing protein [Micromonospora sp. ATCC 39149]EEP73483.1 transcriptional regulator [Micromonospora sp. ATCC 39149]
MGEPRWTTTSDLYLTETAGDAWRIEAAATGQRGSQRILVAETIPAPVNIAHHLGLDSDAPIVIRQRLILADDQPVEIATSYWPGNLASLTVLADPAKIPGGAARFLSELGYTPAEVREDITAGPARAFLTPDEQAALGVATADPALSLTRTLLDHEGRPYQLDVNVMRAGRHIHYVRSAG